MIKTSKLFALSLFLTLACSTAAFADGNAFTPLNFDNTNYNASTVRTSAATTSATPIETSTTSQQVEVTGSSNMQSAILKLDNAQVDVRNELLNLTPDTLHELLFDDIPFLKDAQEEHDEFARILKSNGDDKK